MDYLITGGTGSFGQAFTRRLLVGSDANRVCIYSRDELKQAEMREALGDDGRCRWFIGDVRDRDRLRRAMEGVGVVIHAAALKRVEVGEYNPGEMVKTNVLGAVNVIEAAHDAAVRRVVALSTDKACRPVNAYGQSKALAERLFLAANNARGARGPLHVVTRYGNVAGSRGSVIPRWRALMMAGARQVPVTDPECTRFWMTMGEACDLVLSAVTGEMGTTQPLIPTLPAYRLGDLAEALGVEMDIRGLPLSEKRHETLDGITDSSQARRMTVEELKEGLRYV